MKYYSERKEWKKLRIGKYSLDHTHRRRQKKNKVAEDVQREFAHTILLCSMRWLCVMLHAAYVSHAASHCDAADVIIIICHRLIHRVFRFDIPICSV